MGLLQQKPTTPNHDGCHNGISNVTRQWRQHEKDVLRGRYSHIEWPVPGWWISIVIAFIHAVHCIKICFFNFQNSVWKCQTFMIATFLWSGEWNSIRCMILVLVQGRKLSVETNKIWKNSNDVLLHPACIAILVSIFIVTM